MKILLFSHRLEIGGNSNAIEIAATLRDLYGYEVIFFATPGPNLKLVEERRLRFVPAPAGHFHPSLARMRALRDLVQRERPDLIHAWEYYQCLDAYLIECLLMRVPMSVTGMLMNVSRLLPKTLPTTFGTPELVERARAAGRLSVQLLLPPVDVDLNAPGVVDPRPFREKYGITANEITLVTVSRLSGRSDIKAESLFRTVDAVRQLGRDLPLRLVLVGDGASRAELEGAAAATNAALGREAVVLTGALLDPRPAYAAADIVIGMGGSALRGMAFGKPVIIVGANGFSAPLTPETAASFYYKGMYGVGRNADAGRHLQDIRTLAEDRDRLLRLGEFSRDFVLEHFALQKVTATFAEFCHFAAANQPPLHAAATDGLRTAAIWLRERRWSE